MHDEPLSEQINVRLTPTLKAAMVKRALRQGRRILDVTRRLWELWADGRIDPFAQPLAQPGEHEQGEQHDD